MGEPRLEDISDYNKLKGEKKKVFWAVIIAGLLMGIIYVISYEIYDDNGDTIEVKEKIRNIPMK